MALTSQEEAEIRKRADIAVTEYEAAKEKAAKSKTQAGADATPKTSNGVQEKNSARYSQMENTYNELLSNVTSDVKNDIKNGDIVNILKDYDWIVNKVKTEDLLPCAYIREFRQNVSTFAMSMKWLLSNVSTGFIDTFAKIVGQFSESGGEALKKIGNGLGEAVSNAASSTNIYNTIVTGNNHLSPYENMYSYDTTNCLKYVFPYFDNDYISLSNSFSDSPQTGSWFQTSLANNLDVIAGISGNLQGASNVSDMIGSMLSKDNSFTWSNDGIYLEKPKYFQYESSQDTVAINFILYNTVNHGGLEDTAWKKNYRFIKNIALKNLPYRLDAFKYKTPALYEVSVPGTKYFPVSFVSKLEVKNLGTRRFLQYKTNQKVLVPDAWQITIVFQSLLYKSANLYATALEKGPTIIK